MTCKSYFLEKVQANNKLCQKHAPYSHFWGIKRWKLWYIQSFCYPYLTILCTDCVLQVVVCFICSQNDVGHMMSTSIHGRNYKAKFSRIGKFEASNYCTWDIALHNHSQNCTYCTDWHVLSSGNATCTELSTLLLNPSSNAVAIFTNSPIFPWFFQNCQIPWLF